MESIRVTVKNETGLHARPAALLTRLAAQYQCNIEIVTVYTTTSPRASSTLNNNSSASNGLEINPSAPISIT